MPPPNIFFTNGIDQLSGDGMLQEGFLREIRGAYYKPNDVTQLWKLQGRTEAGDVGQTTNVYGLQHLQYDGGTDQLLVLANSALYEADAATSGMSSWTTAKDAQGTPAAFSRTGSYLRSVPSTDNRWIAFTGADDERPLIRDLDGNWKYLGLKKPSAAPTLNSKLATGAVTKNYPDNVVGSSNWDDTGNAFDADEDTASSDTLSAAGSSAQTWGFNADPQEDGTSQTNGHTLYVKFGTSSLPADGGELPGGGEGGDEESVTASLEIEYSEDSGSTWTTMFNGAVPVSTQTAQAALTDSLSWNNDTIQVRATLTYSSGTIQVTALVYEIWAKTDGTGDAITQGTYYYAVTEVYSRTLSDGSTIEHESAPSDTLSVTISSSKSGIKLDLPSRTNLATDGTASDYLYRKVYRSTSTGVYPNLGYIGQVSIGASSYTDEFSTSGTTLASPTIDTVNVAGTQYPAAAQPPRFKDATVFRGAIVAIDSDTVYWSLPGLPEDWPVPQSFRLLPSDANDTLSAVMAFGDVLLIFASTRVWRLVSLPFANRPTFDLGQLTVDILSPKIGLTGSSTSIDVGYNDAGSPVLFWVAESGVYMTDGGLEREGGMGARPISLYLDWPNAVDTSGLSTSVLHYDPVDQLLYLLADDPNSNRRAFTFHINISHWVQRGALKCPKVTGPHPIEARDLTHGAVSSVIELWSLDGTTGKVYRERTGTSDAAQWLSGTSDIETWVRTDWFYPAGLMGEFQLYKAYLAHSDWGSQSLRLTLESRRDDSGVVRKLTKNGVQLIGSRVTSAWLSKSGQSFRVTLRHVGQASGSLRLLTFEGENMDLIESV